jgi:hypothetical protein
MINKVLAITASALMCLAAFSIAVAAPRSQDDSGKSKKAETSQPSITVHIKVSAEGANPLPDQSSVQLKGSGDCGTLSRKGELDADGKATFSGLPVCKVTLRIFITGFETKSKDVDLADYKNGTMNVQVKSSGPPILN